MYVKNNSFCELDHFMIWLYQFSRKVVRKRTVAITLLFGNDPCVSLIFSGVI